MRTSVLATVRAFSSQRRRASYERQWRRELHKSHQPECGIHVNRTRQVFVYFLPYLHPGTGTGFGMSCTYSVVGGSVSAETAPKAKSRNATRHKGPAEGHSPHDTDAHAVTCPTVSHTHGVTHQLATAKRKTNPPLYWRTSPSLMLRQANLVIRYSLDPQPGYVLIDGGVPR